MTAPSLSLLQHFHHLVSQPSLEPITDATLLDRFARHQDETAFTALVDRHGAMVLQVCRRVLGDVHAAADVFQAVFLVLARKAASLHRPEALAGWLHGVALRLAWKARAEATRRRRRETPPPPNLASPHPDPLEELTARELLGLLDEELHRLPETYRLPLILCCLEGRTQEEAARQLGVTPGAVKGRLERGRARLHDRLARRGLSLSLALLSLELSRSAGQATVPIPLRAAALRGATGGSSAYATALADGVMHTLAATRLHGIGVLCLTLTLLAASAGALHFGMTPGAQDNSAVAQPGDKPAPPSQLRIQWRFKAGGGIEATPVIVGDTVFIASFDKNLYALALDTGRAQWKYQIGPSGVPAAYRAGCVYVGDEDGKFHCVDAKTGQKKWVFDAGAGVTSGPTFAGEDVLFGVSTGTLFCLDNNGRKRWDYLVQGGELRATPVVAQGHVLVAGCDSTLHVLDSRTGAEVRAVDLGGPVAAGGTLSGNVVYVGTMNNAVLAIDWKQGKVLWQYEAARRRQPFRAAAALTERLVIAGSQDQRVHAIDRKTGAGVWSFPTRGRIESTPVLLGQRVVCGSLDGKLYALDRDSGTLLQSLDLDSDLVASPVVAQGKLVIASVKGIVYCLGD